MKKEYKVGCQVGERTNFNERDQNRQEGIRFVDFRFFETGNRMFHLSQSTGAFLSNRVTFSLIAVKSVKACESQYPMN